jgi:hypothetical protein
MVEPIGRKREKAGDYPRPALELLTLFGQGGFVLSNKRLNDFSVFQNSFYLIAIEGKRIPGQAINAKVALTRRRHLNRKPIGRGRLSGFQGSVFSLQALYHFEKLLIRDGFRSGGFLRSDCHSLNLSIAKPVGRTRRVVPIMHKPGALSNRCNINNLCLRLGRSIDPYIE